VRFVFLFALFANLAFYAWMQYLVPPEEGLDAQPLARQVEPAQLRIVSAAELARIPPPAAKSKPKPIPAAPPMVAAILPIVPCLEWGSFALAEAARAGKALVPLALGPRLAERRVMETAKWWVYMSPAGGRPGAVRKAAELKALGVRDFFVVQDPGPYRWKISLGVYKTEDKARERLAALRKQGVRTALIGERESQIPRLWLQIRNVDPDVQVRLNEIAQTFAGSELRECP
jgi:hypothetical protein